jgi:hypothetical protein
MLEFELRGIPTAYITATGRVPTIERDGDGFRLSHLTGSYLVEGWEDSGQQSDDVHRRLIHFGVHRRMRMSGVKEGDRVRYGGRELRWEYPEKELEARFRPAGAGAWSSTLDGVAGYRNIELRAYAAPVEGDEFDESVAEAIPQVVSILTGGNETTG